MEHSYEDGHLGMCTYDPVCCISWRGAANQRLTTDREYCNEGRHLCVHS
jgi:hypothetical protein